MHCHLLVAHPCLLPPGSSAPQHAAVGPRETSDVNGSILHPLHNQLHGTSIRQALGWREEQATSWMQDRLANCCDRWRTSYWCHQLFACMKGRGAGDYRGIDFHYRNIVSFIQYLPVRAVVHVFLWIWYYGNATSLHVGVKRTSKLHLPSGPLLTQRTSVCLCRSISTHRRMEGASTIDSLVTCECTNCDTKRAYVRDLLRVLW